MSEPAYDRPLFDVLRLDGRVALVTGGGRGIGRAIATALAEAGADVAVISRTKEEVVAVADALRERGRKSMALALDVTDGQAVQEASSQIAGVLGPVDILVNNAGTLLVKPIVPLPGAGHGEEPISDDEWQSVISTNLTAPFFMLRTFVPSMLERGWGRIINISSSATARLVPYASAYLATKSAVEALTRSAAAEWGSCGVTVNAIALGHFRTAMTAERLEDPAIREWVFGRVLVKRIGDPREIGAFAVYLASDWGSYITGQTIFVDGGDSL